MPNKKKIDKKTIKPNQNLIKKNEIWHYLLFIVILAFALYGNTIQNGYSIDDDFVTTEKNQLVKKGIRGIPEIFATRYSEGQGQTYGYRPVVKISFAIEYELFGLNPHISHLINILLYALTGIFLFLLLKKILKKYNPLLPFIITILFIAHPIHTEVVASLKNRDEILSFLGSIIALYLFIKYTETNKIINITLGVFFYIIALLSKLSTITFLAVIPLTIYYFTNIPSPLKKIKNPIQEIEIGKHGVIVQQGLNSGVFLPQVATENNWDLEEFMGQLCQQKAGLSKDAWKTGEVDIYVFTAEIFSE